MITNPVNSISGTKMRKLKLVENLVEALAAKLQNLRDAQIATGKRGALKQKDCLTQVFEPYIQSILDIFTDYTPITALCGALIFSHRSNPRALLRTCMQSPTLQNSHWRLSHT